MITDFLENIRKSFNNRITFRKKGEGIYQIIAPFYHEDGDMYDLFLDIEDQKNKVRVCDHGLTLMRLSYTYDLDTPKKEEIFYQILNDNGIENGNGNLFIETDSSQAYYAILRFTQVISKITNMQLYRREVVRSLFYEDLEGFIKTELQEFMPVENYLPIPNRDEFEVDFCFDILPKNLFLFGVKDLSKARLVTISCLEYLRESIPFRSVIVHEDFDSLTAKDRRIITNIADKQFTNFEDFTKNAKDFFARESA